MKNFITLFTLILLSFYLSAQYQITNISGSSYSGSFISGQNSTIYLCNESGVTFYSNLPSSQKVGNKSYSITWQTSSDGNSWFSWSSQPNSTSDRYFRACLSYQKSSTDILYPTAWVKVIHSKVTYVSPPVTLEASEITNTSFTANWINSTTEDNTGGGLCIKHSLGYTSEETTDFSAASSAGKVKWIDVSGLTSYTVSNLTKGTKYYWRVIAQTYNKNTNNYNYTDNTYNWYCGVQTYNSNGIMITETGGACYALQLTAEPLAQILCQGSSVSFTVKVSGSSPVYKWKKNEVVITDNSNISGAESDSLFIKNIQPADTGVYYCSINNECSNVTSQKVNLKLKNSALITKHPVNLIICKGSTANFNIEITGGENTQFRWEKNNIEIDDNDQISGSTTNQLTIKESDFSDTASYSCSITDICGIITSNAAKLLIDEKIVIPYHPRDVITCRGKDISFSVSATGGNIKYQWLKNNISLSDNDFISGVNTNKLIIKQAQLKDTADYLCLLSNACGDTMTAPAKLIVNDTTFKIIENPVTFIKCAGEKGALSVKAEDNNSFFYQWYKEDKLIKNATADTYKIDSLTKQDENFYYCILNNGCVKKSTDTVFILVNLPPVINVAAITTEKQIGDIVVFSLSPSGTPPFTYQWKKNNIIIEDEKEDKLVINPVQLSDAGVYSCLVGNECGSKENEVATLNVKDTVPETFLIYGNVNYDNIDKTVLPGVKVYLNSEAKSELKDSTITDEAGFFQFVAKKGNYFISAKSVNSVKGIDPIDALIINRYYLGSYKFPGTFRLKAANVSNDAIVNPIDALMVIRYYLGVLKKFPSGSWLFEEPHFTVENAEININLKGICFGDVNGSYPK